MNNGKNTENRDMEETEDGRRASKSRRDAEKRRDSEANPSTSKRQEDEWYKKIQSKDNIEKIARQKLFNADAWSHWFSYYSSPPNRDALRAMRRAIWKGTTRSCENNHYFYHDPELKEPRK